MKVGKRKSIGGGRIVTVEYHTCLLWLTNCCPECMFCFCFEGICTGWHSYQWALLVSLSAQSINLGKLCVLVGICSGWKVPRVQERSVPTLRPVARWERQVWRSATRWELFSYFLFLSVPFTNFEFIKINLLGKNIGLTMKLVCLRYLLNISTYSELYWISG